MSVTKDKLMDEIKEQGDIVRKLKSAKADKEQVIFIFLGYNLKNVCSF